MQAHQSHVQLPVAAQRHAMQCCHPLDDDHRHDITVLDTANIIAVLVTIS